MALLKQSTGITRMFLMVDNTSHINGATGKAGSLVVKLSKAGATGVTSTNSATEVDSTNLPGIYALVLVAADVNTTGDLAFAATATGCDPTNWIDQVATHVFADLAVTGAPGSGRVSIVDNLQQNATQIITFQMINSTTGIPMTGLTVTAQRCLGLGGFAACANAVVEISNGVYGITLAATDTNASITGLLFTATGASNLFMPVITTP